MGVLGWMLGKEGLGWIERSYHSLAKALANHLVMRIDLEACLIGPL